MKVLYLLTSPPPPIPGTDAVFQEVSALCARFPATTLNLFPGTRPSRWIPRPLYGLHCRGDLLLQAPAHDLCHLFFPVLYPFPVLRRLRGPLVYSVVAGLAGQPRPALGDLADRLTVVVSNERDRDQAQAWGLARVRLIRPGIDIERFRPTPLPPAPPFVVLVGSAPWTRAQFRTKGIDALLGAAARLPDLRLVFLWRGLHRDVLAERMARLGVAGQCEVINEHADVAALLARCHATAVLADSSKLVKAWPHSLLESLSCGRPVLVSAAVPMADYVAAQSCGVVCPDLSVPTVTAHLAQLRDRREALAAQTTGAAAGFALPRFLDAHAELYRDVCAGRTAGG